MVIFTADHGDMMGDFGLYFKTLMYRGSINVPFIVSYPNGLPANIVSDELVGLQDIYPTVLALADKTCEDVDGIDLVPIANGKSPGRDSYVAYFFTDENPSGARIMLADKDFKYIYNVCGGVEELYDFKNELTNLATSPVYASKLCEKRDELTHWCKENEHLILDDAGFRRLPRLDAAELKPVQNMFGRRKY